MDILKYAMDKEKTLENFYWELSRQAKHPGLEKIFGMLAEIEAKHFNIIQEYQLKLGDYMETDVLKATKDVLSELKIDKASFKIEESEIKLYKKVRDIEKESEAFYLQKAGETADASVKQLLETLAREEKKHFFLMDNLVEFASRPQQWLENAEWNNFDVY